MWGSLDTTTTQAAALASMESQSAKQRAPTAGTCQTMQSSVVLGIVVLKASKRADSGAGCPKVEARFPSIYLALFSTVCALLHTGAHHSIPVGFTGEDRDGV